MNNVPSLLHCRLPDTDATVLAVRRLLEYSFAAAHSSDTIAYMLPVLSAATEIGLEYRV
jgi:hypothetical protein